MEESLEFFAEYIGFPHDHQGMFVGGLKQDMVIWLGEGPSVSLYNNVDNDNTAIVLPNFIDAVIIIALSVPSSYW